MTIASARSMLTKWMSSDSIASDSTSDMNLSDFSAQDTLQATSVDVD
jgi:hypothetical protein